MVTTSAAQHNSNVVPDPLFNSENPDRCGSWCPQVQLSGESLESSASATHLKQVAVGANCSAQATEGWSLRLSLLSWSASTTVRSTLLWKFWPLWCLGHLCYTTKVLYRLYFCTISFCNFLQIKSHFYCFLFWAFAFISSRASKVCLVRAGIRY